MTVRSRNPPKGTDSNAPLGREKVMVLHHRADLHQGVAERAGTVLSGYPAEVYADDDDATAAAQHVPDEVIVEEPPFDRFVRQPTEEVKAVSNVVIAREVEKTRL